MSVMIPFPNISPEIFSISVGGLEVALRWYALSYIVGFFLALYIMKSFVQKDYLWPSNQAPLRADQPEAMLTYLIVGVIIGGRLGYVLFYNSEYYLFNPIDVIKIWDGGMSFHGGFIGVVLAVVLFCKINTIQIWATSDLVALSTPPGLFLGRVANFINAELWGRPTDLPWGVVFPGVSAQQCEGVVGLCARHPSQLYEAVLEGIILLFILLVLALKGALRRPGLITGVFGVWYGLSRFFIEYYRVPDRQFVSYDNPYGFAYILFGDFGITMGQALSLPMIVIGITIIFLSLMFKSSK